MSLGTGTDLSGARKPSSVEWDGYESDLFAHRFTDIPTNMQGRWAYDESGNLIYAGFAPRGLAEGTDGWLLHKFTWETGNCTKREIAYGNWTGRADATYA